MPKWVFNRYRRKPTQQRASRTGLTARVVKTAGSFGNQMQEFESSKQKWLDSLVGTSSELVAVLG